MSSVASRVLRRHLAARNASARHVSMGSWDGVDHFWPDVPDFEISPEKRDAFGDFYEVMYQESSKYFNSSVVVWFKYKGHSPLRTGMYDADIQGRAVSGTWKSEEDIPGILKELAKEERAAAESIRKQVLNLGGSSWDVGYDGLDVDADFENPNKYSEVSMSVLFEEVSEALVKGNTQTAEIHFRLGADPAGPFGEKSESRTYVTIKDMEKILKEAEGLWVKWMKEQGL